MYTKRQSTNETQVLYLAVFPWSVATMNTNAMTRNGNNDNSRRLETFGEVLDSELASFPSSCLAFTFLRLHDQSKCSLESRLAKAIRSKPQTNCSPCFLRKDQQHYFQTGRCYRHYEPCTVGSNTLVFHSSFAP